MARIPDEELERIKREVSVAEIARTRGVELKAHGSNLIGLCPFHDDHEPSFVVTPSKNLWHCLGACQAGGTNIDFVMRSQGVSFRHAVEILRSGDLFLAASYGPALKRSHVPKLPLPFAPELDDRALLKEMVRFYHKVFKESPEAAAYLEGRGLRSAEMIGHFQIGFANRTLGYRLPGKHTRAGAEIRGRLQRIGIVAERGHEHFNGSVIFPVFDEHGDVTEIYGRKITAELPKRVPLHMYLPGPHRGVWNLAALQASREVILCESIIDALSFWCAGFRNVTASYGVEGFTDDHLAAFQKYGTERVLIAYDRDEAGNRAAVKLAERLVPLGIECLRVNFPHQMDANAYALKVTPAERSLAVVLNAAEWMGGRGGSPQRGGSVLATTPATVTAGEPNSPLAAASTPAAPPCRPNSTLRLIETPVGAPVAPPDEPPNPPPTNHEPPTIPVDERPDGLLITLGDRVYRVRGLEKNTAYEKLAVNLRVGRADAYHQDNVDLADAKKRAKYIECAAVEIAVKEDVVKRDLGKILLKLEELQDQMIRKTLAPKEKTVHLSEAEQAAALELLKDPNLLERILADFERCGVVGERTNKLVGYLAAVSRLLEKPLGVMIQSSSAAGKTALMDAVLGFVPSEQQVKYSAMTGQSLFYMGEQDLRHKILAVAEEEGASRATYALKLLQSEGELSIASTGKDPQSGKLVTHEYRVTGPVMTIFSTTAVELDPELQNRCVVLGVDESREQTRAIHAQQRREQSAGGMWERRQRKAIRTLHQNAQRLLKPLDVDNPFVDRLTFPDTSTRTRRDHLKYLTLIQTIALLHQHQRPLRSETRGDERREFIEVTADDVRLANQIAAEVLGRSLDELAPQTRRLLLLIHCMVAERCGALHMQRSDFRFSRREVREHTGLGHAQLAVHMKRLEELEYLAAHRGRQGQGFVYELLYDGEGQDGRPSLPGLIDPDDYDRKFPGSEANFPASESNFPGSIRGTSGPLPAPFREGVTGAEPFSANAAGDLAAETARNAYKREEKPPRSYVNRDRTSPPPARMPDALASLAAAAEAMLEAEGIVNHTVAEVVARTANGNGQVASSGNGL